MFALKESELRVILFMLMVLGARAAIADERVPADPWEVVHTARDFGTADVGKDALKDWAILGEIDKRPYEIVFHDCYLGRDCSVALFRMSLYRDAWEDDGPDEDIAIDWNREKLFGRAFVDDDNRLVLEMPVNMKGGLPPPLLQSTFDWWREISEEFTDAAGF